MLGVEKNKVALVPHDEGWADEYRLAKDELENILGGNVAEIHHVGSTAIAGISAKPILDVAIVVKSVEAIDFAGMEAAGYEYIGERIDTGKHFFVRGKEGGISTHHVGCYPENSENCESAVLFCNYLNEHPECAAQYSDLKIELASKYPDDRLAYAEAKSAFIEDIVAIAKGKQKNA